MFDQLTIHGGEATITWAWHTAAVCRSWRITKVKAGAWTLDATITRADSFKLKQRPLLFNVPRKGGFMCWPVTAITLGQTQLQATLGQPEH